MQHSVPPSRFLYVRELNSLLHRFYFACGVPLGCQIFIHSFGDGRPYLSLESCFAMPSTETSANAIDLPSVAIRKEEIIRRKQKADTPPLVSVVKPRYTVFCFASIPVSWSRDQTDVPGFARECDTMGLTDSQFQADAAALRSAINGKRRGGGTN